MLIRLMKEKIKNKEIEHVYITENLISTAQLHKDTFLPFKNYCQGTREIVVCGAGPSLNEYQPIRDAVHIAVNRAFLFDKVDFDFIFAQDFEGVNMVQEELVSYRPDKCVKFLGTQSMKTKKIPESLIIRSRARKFDTDWYIPGSGIGGQLVVDLDRKPLCNMYNVGQSVMQLALYMNPSRIYIVGCDMSGNHFATGNQTPEEVKRQEKILQETWKKKREQLLARWREIKEFASVYYPDTEIVSVNPVGLKGVFRDIYQDDLNAENLDKYPLV